MKFKEAMNGPDSNKWKEKIKKWLQKNGDKWCMGILGQKRIYQRVRRS